MAITKQKKEEIVKKMTDAFGKAKSVVFVNFKGIKVNEQNKLRKTLRENEVGYTVAKKTLVSLALDKAKFSGERPNLGTELAVAWSDDNLASHREIGTFALKNKEQMTIIGGMFEGEYIDADKVKDLATIPSMDTLRAQFVNLINSPIQRFAIALDAIAKSKPQG